MSIWHVLGLYHKKIGGPRANIWSQGTVKVEKSLKKTRHEHDVMAFYTKLYWFHHGHSLPRTFSPLTFSITEPSQVHSSCAIGFSHYAPLMDIQI